MKKIIFLINTMLIGGAENVLVDIANSLDKKKFEVTILSIYSDNEIGFKLDNNVNQKFFCKVNTKTLIDKIIKKILYWCMINLPPKILYKMIIKEKYDIEVGFVEGLPCKIISGSNRNTKKIAWIHSDLFKNRESDFLFKNENIHKKIYKKFNEIYCVSEEARKAFIERFNIYKNIYVVYNIINEKMIKKLSLETINDINCNMDFKIVSLGRLVKIKGFDRLIEAYCDIYDKIPFTTHLYIIGDGPEMENLITLIYEKNMKNHITLLGSKKNPYPYLKIADLYVSSSHIEGYSIATLEALCLNLPILVTDCTGQNQILENGKYGLIVDNNIQSLKEGLKKIILNDSMRQNYIKNTKSYINVNGIEKIQENILR